MLNNIRKSKTCWPEYRNAPPCGWWVSVCAAPVCSLRLHPQRAAAASRQPPAAARIINNTLVPLCTFPSPLSRHLSWNQAGMQSALHRTPSICCTDYAFVLFTVISYASLPYLPTSNKYPHLHLFQGTFIIHITFHITYIHVLAF